MEVAIVAEEFGRGLVDAPFLGPVLADDLSRQLAPTAASATVIDGAARIAVDARGYRRGLELRDTTVLAADRRGAPDCGPDPHRRQVAGAGEQLGELSAEAADPLACARPGRHIADLVGTSRGALALATEYAKIREQYGNTIGSYQAVAHLLAEEPRR